MTYSMGSLERQESLALVHQFITEQFPGCQISGVGELMGPGQWIEYDVWIEGNPVIKMVEIDSDWSQPPAYEEKLRLTAVHLHSGVVLIPNDKRYHEAVRAITFEDKKGTEMMSTESFDKALDAAAEEYRPLYAELSHDERIAIHKVLEDKVWLDRHRCLISEGKLMPGHPSYEDAVEAQRRIEAKYGKANLGPYTDEEWATLSGKLLAVRQAIDPDGEQGCAHLDT